VVALILADGDAPTRDQLDRGWPGWFDEIGLVIAADGGARHARTFGVDIDLWVGDGDSLGDAGIAELVARGVAIERWPTDKDRTDTELAVLAAIARDHGVVIVGAMGGERIDHALANVNLLSLPELVGRAAGIYTSAARIRLVRGDDPDGPASWTRLTGATGDLVSLLPVGGTAVGVSTRGLAYPLADESLHEGSSRGLSNVVTAVGAVVTLRQGSLLIVESPATLRA
jgi:thiamine pyrophosphokinase